MSNSTDTYYATYRCAFCGEVFTHTPAAENSVPSKHKARQVTEAGLSDVPPRVVPHDCVDGDVGHGEWVGWRAEQ